MTTKSLQFLRKSQLIVADEQGDGIDLSSLRITFKIKKSDTGIPNAGVIRAYNLSENTVSRIKNEFTRITLQAGYESNFGLIFKGNIKQVSFGRESSTDNYIDIAAGDGDDAYNFSVVNKTLSAGSTQIDQINAAVEPMQPNGVTLGFVGNLGDSALSRGKVMYGMSRDYLSQSAEATDTTWCTQNNVIQIVQKTSTLPAQLIILNSKTGMIGTPIQTNNGVVIRTLLNPLIKVGGKVQINNGDIADAKLPETATGAPVNNIPSKSADGIYRVLVVEYTGDNFGNDWFSDLTCLAVDETAGTGDEVLPT